MADQEKCLEILELVLQKKPLLPEAVAHIKGCPSCQNLGKNIEILRQAQTAYPQGPSPAQTQRFQKAMQLTGAPSVPLIIAASVLIVCLISVSWTMFGGHDTTPMAAEKQPQEVLQSIPSPASQPFSTVPADVASHFSGIPTLLNSGSSENIFPKDGTPTTPVLKSEEMMIPKN